MQFGLSAALFQAAYQHFLAGSLLEAEHACRQVLQADPRHADSLHLLGVIAGQAGHPQASLELFDQALAASPGFAEAHCNRGVALGNLGRLEEAEQAFRRSLALKPRQAEAWFGLGNLKAGQNASDAAIEAFRQALQMEPDNAPTWTNLAISLQRAGKLDEAVEAYERARAILPGVALFHLHLAIAYLDQGRIDEAVAGCRQAVKLDPRFAQAHSNALLCMTYQAGGSAAERLAAHTAWDRAHGEPVKPASAVHANGRDPERRLKIGYVSGDFHTHPVGWLLANVLPAHDKTNVEVFCYANASFSDRITERLKGAADHWRDIAGLSDDALAALVRQDGIDILVDLSGHTDKNRLLTFARKPAPVQASWLGYPGATGMSAMDYLIMDAVTAPAGAEAWCAEALIRLPHGRFCYAPPVDAPPVAERPRGAVVFGSFNHLAKIGPEVVRLWAKVLAAVPRSRLVLKWKALSEASARERLTAAFAAEGIEADRLELRGASPHADMLAEYGDIDIALDPFPYGGGMTSAEALWMGVPVVTWPQDRIASRQTVAFLTELGLTDLAAGSADDYVRIAADLAADPARRADLRRTLRPRMAASPLTDGVQFTPGLEAAYRQMWRRWCAGEAASALTIT
jgi:predicted O-linked N-acetylglucosamine transferase (SPINDLY family)